MGGGGVPNRNLYKEITQEYKARRDTMPGILGAEAEFQPQYDALELGNINDILNGTKAGSREVQYQDYEDRTATKWNPYAGRGGAVERTTTRVPVMRTRTVNYDANPGLKAISRGIDPATAALQDKLTAAAGAELDMGGNLDPSLARTATQAVRLRNQGSLGNTGTAGNFREALGVSEFANNLRNQRRGFATAISGQNQQRNDALFSQAQNISRGIGPKLFAPSSNANDVYSSNQNAQAAGKAADAQLAAAGIMAGAAFLF